MNQTYNCCETCTCNKADNGVGFEIQTLTEDGYENLEAGHELFSSCHKARAEMAARSLNDTDHRMYESLN